MKTARTCKLKKENATATEGQSSNEALELFVLLLQRCFVFCSVHRGCAVASETPSGCEFYVVLPPAQHPCASLLVIICFFIYVYPPADW